MTTIPVTRTLNSSRRSLMKVAVVPGLGAWSVACAWLVPCAWLSGDGVKSAGVAAWEAGVMNFVAGPRQGLGPHAFLDDSKFGARGPQYVGLRPPPARG